MDSDKSQIEKAVLKLIKMRDIKKDAEQKEKFLKTMLDSELGIGEHPFEKIGVTVKISVKGRYNVDKGKVIEALNIDETKYSQDYCKKSTWNEVRLNKWGSSSAKKKKKSKKAKK